MKNLIWILAVLLFSSCAFASGPKDKLTHGLALQQAPTAGSSAATKPTPTEPEAKRVTAYTLPPDLYRKARDLGRIHFRFDLINFVYGLIVLWVVLRWKLAPKFRDWAEKTSTRPFLQSLVFSPLVLLAIAVLTLPSDIYAYRTEKRFGLSVQGWASWTGDWLKSELVSIIIGTILIWLLYVVIRRSARRWWFYFWLISLPIGVFLIFLQPLVIDPMFHKFEPLHQKDPVLTAGLERLVQRAGVEIPPQRMFWMGAGEKTTELNAYVAGLGTSKRIVVWDNTIAKMNAPQIVFVVGHEMGHYVLSHIPKLLMFLAVFLLALFYLAYRTIGWALAKWGTRWGILGLKDWASLPALLLLFSVFSFIAGPIGSAVSRHYEHQADQYGLEVTHGLTPDSGQVAAQAFQVLGEVDLSDPEPNPVNVFLFYSHPPIPDRVQFALTYHPWEEGKQPEFVK